MLTNIQVGSNKGEIIKTLGLKFGALVGAIALMVVGPALSASATTYADTECGVPLSTSTTVSTGTPGTNYYKNLQCFAKLHGDYEGPVNGIPGVNTWKGIQRVANNWAPSCYGGWVDAVTDHHNRALQCIGRETSAGYTGPINGILGPNIYKTTSGYFNYLLINVWAQ